jgi:hypothetical protein
MNMYSPSAPPEEYSTLLLPTELQCVVCSRYSDTHKMKFPCDCERNIHLHCIEIWKQYGGLCTQCGKEWIIPHEDIRLKIRYTNLKWASLCIFVICLTCFLFWLFIHFVIQSK